MAQPAKPVAFALEMLLLDRPPSSERFLDGLIQRWGPLTTEGLVAMLSQTKDETERLFALLALSDASDVSAGDTLPQYLTSERPLERWASAIALAKRRDARAVPALITMLTEFLPPNAESSPSWLHACWRNMVPRLLGDYGNPSASVPLRHALEDALQIEQAIRAPRTQSSVIGDPEVWQIYQDEIIYALGRLGAYGALTGIVVPDARLDIWRVHLLLGSLRGLFRTTGILLWEDYPEISQEISRRLERIFGLSPSERTRCLERYEASKSFEMGERLQEEERPQL